MSVLLRFLLSSPSTWVGTLPAGGSFCSGKRNQNPLRAFPPKNLPEVRGCLCVKLPFGPSPLLWLLPLLPSQACMATGPIAGWFPCPGLCLVQRCFHRRASGHRQLETAAYQGKALGVKVLPDREAGTFHRILSIHLCDPTRPRAEKRRTQKHSVPAGWIP